MEYRCRLASPNGEIIEGVYAADTEVRLRHDLEEKGLYVLSVHPKGAVGGLSLRLPQRRRIATSEFLVFNQELATLLKAGMPLVQSLDLLKRRIASPLFHTILDDVHERVRSGTALSDAFGAQGDLFPRVYTASLLAGERSGSLETVLRRYVEYTKIVATLKRKITTALIYPTVLVALSLVLMSIIVLKVVPAFTDYYQDFGAHLPFFTRVIFGISDFIRSNVVVIALVIVGGAIAFAGWLTRPGQQARFDHLILRVPGVGPVARKFATSQMARTLATLLGGGLPLVNALDIAARSIGTQHIAGQLDIVGSRVREGEAVAAALEARGEVPEDAVEMAAVREADG